jgi:hypothetical protein
MSSGLLTAPHNEHTQNQYFLRYGEEYIYKSSPFPCQHGYWADCHKESAGFVDREETIGCLWFCSSGWEPVTKRIKFLFGFVVAKVRLSKSWRRIGLVTTTEIQIFDLEEDPRPRTLEWQEIDII